MRQYGRQYRLEFIGDKETLVIDKLRVSFSITKDIQSKPNPAEISVYNLTREHINELLTGKYKQASLAVGYESLTLLFAGDISKVRVKRDGLDFVLTFECGDGLTKYLGSRSQVTIKSGSTDQQLIEQLQKDLNIQAGAVETINKAKYPRGQVLNGDTRALLDRIAKTNNAQWSIQDGKLVFLPITHATSDDIVVLSQDTGMVNSPEHTDSGLEVQCLLNPNIKVGGLVQIKSIFSYFDGQYKVVKVEHSGDNIGGDWLSSLTVIGGKFKEVKSK